MAVCPIMEIRSYYAQIQQLASTKLLFSEALLVIPLSEDYTGDRIRCKANFDVCGG
jgi:hypothetical protein